MSDHHDHSPFSYLSATCDHPPSPALIVHVDDGPKSWDKRIPPTVSTAALEPARLISLTRLDHTLISPSTATTSSTPYSSLRSTYPSSPEPSGATSAPADEESNLHPPSPGNRRGAGSGASPLNPPTPPTTTLPNINRSAVDYIQVALPLFRDMQQPGTNPPAGDPSLPNPLASSLARDALLVYAHQLYNNPPIPQGLDEDDRDAHLKGVFRSQLLPLLTNLRALHPQHVPSSLLLGCVYHALGDYDECLDVNRGLLEINGGLVEAMSNIGAALKAKGRVEEAVDWWWKAVSKRPTYWDAVNNLLGTLVSSEQARVLDASKRAYSEVLRLCTTVHTSLIDDSGTLSQEILPKDIHHFQNLLYVSGSIRCLPSQMRSIDGVRDLLASLEALLHLAGDASTKKFTFRSFFLAEYIYALLSTDAVPEVISGMAAGLGYPSMVMDSYSKGGQLLEFVDAAGDDLWNVVIEEGFGIIPAVFLSPSQAKSTLSVIFQKSFGVFPSLCAWSKGSKSLEKPTEKLVATSCEMASNTLMSTAKVLQESADGTIALPSFRDPVRLGPAFTLRLYYLAYAMHPTPSACNNLGIILSTTPWSESGGLNANPLARQFYEKGLEMDPDHAHLLTNFGSLMKEDGELDLAIDLYKRAVKVNPEFDLALTNLANVLKDVGRLTESIPFYRQALSANPNQAEALCGLTHATWSIADWRGLGKISEDMNINDDGAYDSLPPEGEVTDDKTSGGWMSKLLDATQEQLVSACRLNKGIVRSMGTLDDWIDWIEECSRTKLRGEQLQYWRSVLKPYFEDLSEVAEKDRSLNEGGFVIRTVEWLIRHLQWRWYIEGQESNPSRNRGLRREVSTSPYCRPHIPSSLALQPAPSVLPFHTFVFPFDTKTIRLIAYRNALRVSHNTLTRSWLPETVYAPPSKPHKRLNIGYISSDFMDHPTTHLMASVFGLHDRSSFRVYGYSLQPSDGSTYRKKVEQGVDIFRDVSMRSTQNIVEQIVRDEIHILVNLNGYTKGSRNDIFAARPCPLQISLLGFAGTLEAGWCDYMVCDPIVCPPNTRTCEACNLRDTSHGKRNAETEGREDTLLDLGPDPESDKDWKYMERFMYMPHTYLVTDHKQAHKEGPPNESQWKKHERQRTILRRSLFPDVNDDTIIFANFNQIVTYKAYKLDPSIFLAWLRILRRVPNSVLWLLRFPPAAEDNIIRTARMWAGQDFASRIRFTDVTEKDVHIQRCKVPDIFLDTVECNAHTVAADVLWSATPIITWPKYSFKMCSRAGASIAFATGFGPQMVTNSLVEYEDRAVSLALSAISGSFRKQSHSAPRKGELRDLRRELFMNREKMPLFDCTRWTRNLEKGYKEAWRRWERGGTTTHFEIKGRTNHPYEHCNGFIWIRDEDS